MDTASLFALLLVDRLAGRQRRLLPPQKIRLYNSGMRAVLKSLDPVMLNYAANLLEQEGIESVVFDTHASVMDGSMGFLPRRLMVLDEDFGRAEKLLRDALPEAM